MTRSRSRRILLGLVLGLALGVPEGRAFAQTDAAAPTPAPAATAAPTPATSPTPTPAPGQAAALDPAAVEAARQAVSEEIQALSQRIGESGATEQSTARLDRLRILERTYAQQLDLLHGEPELSEREKQAQQRLASGPQAQLSQSPPYVLAVLDALADARDAQKQRTQTVKAALEAADKERSAAAEELDRAERARRRQAEAAEKATDPTEAAKLAQALGRAELDSRVAHARVDLAALEYASLQRKLEVQRHDERLLDETVTWVRDHLSLGSTSTQAERERLDALAFETKRKLEDAQRASAAAERQLSQTERRLEGEPTSPVHQAELAARRSELQLEKRRVEDATTTLARIDAQQRLEEWRLSALSGDVPRAKLLEWQAKLEADRAESQRSQQLLQVRRGDTERELSEVRAAEAGADPDTQRWLLRRASALEAILELHAQDAAGASRLDTLRGRVLAEVSRRTARPSLRDRAEDVGRAIAGAWQFELFAAADRPITLGKLVTALLLFVLGFVVARVASRLLGRLLVRRVALATGAATAIQALLFYLLLLLFFLMALRTVNIPLTAFTVLGGALAIGVGFGSQNIVNNFISGLILLAERPIKVGDVIELDGQRGTVEWIGPRSTRVRTPDNIHIIVPNSAFLEKSVINWTLSDDDVRTQVDVGVAYGSPTRDVQRLMHRAISEHGKILARPEPLVLFSDFGNDALLFRAYFWIRSRNMVERLTIESDVRYRIDNLFREAGITIAFPQRDVHLDADRPLPVRLVEPGEPGEPEDD